MNNILEVDGMSKRYENFALRNMTFYVPKGSIVGLIGENGAGKSTALKTILGICPADEGSIKFCGKEFSNLSASEKEQIGVVFDDNVFYENLSATELEKIFSKIYEKWDRKYYLELLDRFHILADKKLSDYSKGMKSKLSLICALCHHPTLLVIDESLSALDPVIRDEVLGLLREFVEDGEKAVLFSCHIIEDLQKIADYIILINRGELVFEKSIDELLFGNAVVHCTRDQMSGSDKKNVAADLAVNQASIDEILKVMIKGA